MQFSWRRMAAIAVACLATVSVTAGSPASAPGDKIFRLGPLHRIHVTISPAEWAVLQTSQPRGGAAPGVRNGSDYKDNNGRQVHIGNGFGGYFPWARADVRFEDSEGAKGATIKDAGLRYKGNLSFQRSTAAAPLFASFKLKLDLHGTKGSWDGERTFNLHPGVVDISKTRETLAYAIFRAAGVPASRTTYAEIFFTVPGVFQETSGGIFTIIEDVNKTFLERTLPLGTGLLMKPEGLGGGIQNLGDNWADYLNRYRPARDATAHEQERVIELGKLVSQPDVATFRSKIGTYIDVDELLRYIAVNVFIVNSDSFFGGGHNIYLYLDPADDRMRFIPWDQDLSMGGGPMGVVAPRAPVGNGGVDILQPFRLSHALLYWLLDDPVVSGRYREILRELSATAFSAAEITKLADTIDKVAPGRMGPPPREFLQGRAAYVQQLVASWGVK